jgi:hypothetical protein
MHGLPLDIQPPQITLDPSTHVQEARLPFTYRVATVFDSSNEPVLSSHTYNVDPGIATMYTSNPPLLSLLAYT